MASAEENLLVELRKGNEQALADLFSLHRERLWKLVNFRLPARLAGRVDVEDVLQEGYLAAAERLHHFLKNPFQSFFVWLRLIVLQTLTDLYRQHLGTKGRDANREISCAYSPPGMSTSASVAAHLLGSFTSPSMAAMRAERNARLETAIENMNAIDREVLALRHFEELTNQETAEVLGIEEKAASNRYVRALKRLKEILSAEPEFQE